jgi:antitoxin component HigA of HigAB toxin-antitoxin module
MYRPIKSLAQFKSYESYLEKLQWIGNKTPADKKAIEELTAYIREWNKENGSGTKNDSIELLVQIMNRNNIRPSELASEFNLSQSTIADILNYRTPLPDALIQKLAVRFDIPVTSFQ